MDFNDQNNGKGKLYSFRTHETLKQILKTLYAKHYIHTLLILKQIFYR